MRPLKELMADPTWMALHNKTMAIRRGKHERAVAAVRRRRYPGSPVIKALAAETARQANTVELFGEIGESSAYEFKRRLARCDRSKPLMVRIDSPGGSIGPATSIYDAIFQWPANTIAMIESNAYSCGSFIAMACRERRMTANGLMMVHAPYFEEPADALPSDIEVLAKMGETLAKAYGRHCVGGRAMAQKLMNRPANDDSWLTAQEALRLGLITAIGTW